MKTFLITALLLVGSIAAGTAGPDTAKEIESLLAYVGKMEGATFIRSGKSYSAKDAEAHLRMKWGKVKKKIKTGDDFIKHIASKSYLTGKEYRIRFRDGTERPSGKVLTEQLKKIRVAGND